MKRFLHGDFVNGDIAKTGDKSSLRWGYSRLTRFKHILKLI